MRPRRHPALLLALLAGLLAACVSSPALSPTAPASAPPASATPPPATVSPAPTGTFTPTATPEPLAVRFAVIGDYGWDGPAEADVAALVHSWQPDIILTVGDNNQSEATGEMLDANIGKYYHDYIYPYNGAYGPGADVNRFFPAMGNHDWYIENGQPYFDYFTLPFFLTVVSAPLTLLSGWYMLYESNVWTLTYREMKALEGLSPAAEEVESPAVTE